jgi:hypothetical protein
VLQWLPHGELHLTEVPDKHWDTVSVDFIVNLLEVHRFNVVIVVVDVLSKWAHFNKCPSGFSAVGATQLYYRNMWRYYGTPQKYISDRSPQFIVEFT